MQLWIPLVLALSLAACGAEEGGEQASSDSGQGKPAAVGRPGDIVVVMDTTQWAGPLGEKVRDVFAGNMPGLNWKESRFQLTHIDPLRISNMLKRGRNMVYVMTLDNMSDAGFKMRRYFTEESLEQIKKDTTLHYFRQRNQQAAGQEILYLFARTQKELYDYLDTHAYALREIFNQVERDRMHDQLTKMPRSKNVEATLKRLNGVRLLLPRGYQLVRSEEDFFWLRLQDGRQQRHIFGQRLPYTEGDFFQPERLEALRDSITRRELYGDPDDPDSYVEIQQRAPLHFDTLNFRGRSAIEMRGLWRTHNLTRGGPFLSYAFTSEDQTEVFFIDAFVYYPNEDKRAILRELEAILWTFEEVSD